MSHEYLGMRIRLRVFVDMFLNAGNMVFSIKGAMTPSVGNYK